MNRFFRADGKYPNGKYQFNDFADISICQQFTDIGFCISGITYKFKKGDVIDVTNQFYDDNTQEWQAQLPITEQNSSVPFSILTKVDDSTPVTMNFERTSYTTNPTDYEPVYTGGGGEILNPKSDCNEIMDLKWHCIRKEAQYGIMIGAGSLFAYGVYNKKTPASILGLTLLGALAGIVASSFVKNKGGNSTTINTETPTPTSPCPEGTVFAGIHPCDPIVNPDGTVTDCPAPTPICNPIQNETNSDPRI